MNRPHRSPRRGDRPRQDAFSLIEVLAAMTILALIVLMAAQLFAGSAQFWKQGSRRIEQDMNARAALELIGRQLVMANANSDLLTFRVDRGNPNYHGGTFATISMVSMDHQARSIETSPGSGRSAFFRDVQETKYAVATVVTSNQLGGTYLLATNTVLVRYGIYREYPLTDPDVETPRVITCYGNKQWAEDGALPESERWPEPQILADNVVKFDVTVVTVPRFTDSGGFSGPQYPFASYGDSTITNQRVAYVDLALCLVDEDDMLKARAMSGSQTHFNRTMRRYTHRAFFQNARGMEHK